jgi:hypothetical protein
MDSAPVARATAFVLVDEAGRERARLGFTLAGAPGLVVLDDEGRRRLLVGEMDDRSSWGLRVYGEQRVNRMTLGLWDDEAVGVRVFDEEGAKRVGMGWALAGDNGGIALLDGNGQERLGMGMGPGGGGDFVAKDGLGNDVWRALGPVGPPALP